MTRIIEIELNELEIPKDRFKDISMMTSVHLYMLSKENIAISFETSSENAQKSIWNDKMGVKETDKTCIFVLPKKVSDLYHITPHNLSVSVSQKTDIIYLDIE